MYLYVPSYISSPDTQMYFDQAIINDFQISYDEFVIARKLLGNELEMEVDEGINFISNATKYLIFRHQKINRAHNENKTQNVSKFENRSLLKTCVDFDGKRYPNSPEDSDFATDKNRNEFLALLELYKDYISENYCLILK